MASVKRRIGAKHWVACYSLPDGTRLQRSTKTGDKAQALTIAMTLQRAARLHVAEDQARVLMSDLVERLQGEAMSKELAVKFFHDWIKNRESELAPSTLDTYRLHIDNFIKHIGGEKSKMALAGINAVTLSNWRSARSKVVTAATANQGMKAVGGALQDAFRMGLIAENPMRRIKPLRKSAQTSRSIFDLEQVRALLATADGDWHTAILAGLYTGQRLSDVVTMRWDQLDLTGGWWRFASKKTRHELAVPLAAALLENLSAMHSKKADKQYVMPELAAMWVRCGQRSYGLSSQFHKLMTRAGVVPHRSNKKKKQGRAAKREVGGLSYHCLRHTLTTWLKAGGVSESVAMAIVGHESKQISRSYTHMPEKSLQDAIKLLPAV